MWKKELIADGKRTEEELQDPTMVEIIADLEIAPDINNAIELNKAYIKNCIDLNKAYSHLLSNSEE